MVVIGTFEWCSIRLFGKVPLLDIITGISVAVITVLTDNLALAVIVGVILSALSFAWESANKIHLITKKDSDGNNIHEVHGTIFFASKDNFLELFNPKEDTQEVFIDFKNSKVLDHSAIQVIDKLASKYKRHKKSLHLQHLSLECRLVLQTAKNLVEVNVLEDPDYRVADDKLA